MRGERYGKGESGWGRRKRVRDTSVKEMEECPSCSALRSRIALLEAALCRAREAWENYKRCPQECFDASDGHGYEMQDIFESALSSTGPCRHEEELKEEREMHKWTGAIVETERAENKRLKEAVEWACSDESFWLLQALKPSGPVMAFQDELRRRAGMEGEDE